VVSSENSDLLKNKDRIVSVNNQKVTTTAEMNQIIDQCKVGDTVSIVISRNGEESTVSLRLEEYVPDSIKNGLQ
jgi:PDZ domain-containing secreted protein